jgi:Predicted membrane protein
MVGSDTSLAGGLIAAFVLFVVNFTFKQLIYRFPRFNRIIQGEPILLIYKGKLNHKNIEKAKLTLDEVREAIREHGVSYIEDVDLAVLEVDGNLSVLSDDFKHRTYKKRKAHKSINKNEN